MSTPIDSLKKKYESAVQHLSAITQVRKAVEDAYGVGRRTITTDDWCDSL
jgi:hypothetical protein